jgi:uncharacterized repeat protein (TIGR02543 family)
VTATGGTGDAIYAGGIAGYFNNTSTVSYSYNAGDVTSRSEAGNAVRVGGIAGYSASITISYSYNAGDVTASGINYIYAGGIAGHLSSNMNTISGSYNTGRMTASGIDDIYAGGIVGRLEESGVVSISHSYYNGDNFTGDAVGSKPGALPDAAKTTAQMTADETLTAGMGEAFFKRANDTKNGILYYPELKVFADSSDPAVAAASRISVAIGATSYNKIIYKIIYDFQGGAPENGDVRFDLVEYGHAFELSTPTRAHYTFLGWFDAEIGGNAYADANGLGVASDVSEITLYARWEVAKYALTYIDGGENSNPSDYTFGAETPLAPATRTGYTFDGWYDNEGFGGNAITSIAADSDTPKIFYAKWIVNRYTVGFDANGGEGEPALDGEYEYGAGYTLAQNAYTREGYTFSGWNTEPDGSGTAYADGQDISNLTAEDGGAATLYAQWIKIPEAGDIADGLSPVESLDWTIPLLAGINILLLIGTIAMVRGRKKRTVATAAAASGAGEVGEVCEAAHGTEEADESSDSGANAKRKGGITINLFGDEEGAPYGTLEINGQNVHNLDGQN